MMHIIHYKPILQEDGKKHEHALAALEVGTDKVTVSFFVHRKIRRLSEAGLTSSRDGALKAYRKQGFEMSAASTDETIIALER